MKLTLGNGIPLGIWLIAASAYAGGSGLNTLVVANSSSPQSVDLANYFCERRAVPPGHLVRITWTGGNIAWDQPDFQTRLLHPVLAALSERSLSNQIHYVVLSMDIPFQTRFGDSVNSTTSALFYGLKTGRGSGWALLTNSYAGTESHFPDAKPLTAQGPSFLTTMITAQSLAEACSLVDRGVASDGSWPVRPVLYQKTSDYLRNFRYRYFDNALFNIRVLGNGVALRNDSNSTTILTNLLGLQTGQMRLSLQKDTFLPGAIADSLTSYGGIIFGPNDQTTLLTFIQSGATASYGTVTEPSPNPQKFPDPLVYFYQHRGFTAAEAYYQSLFDPHQGLLVAEPLSAPFARRGSGRWLNPPVSVLSGTVTIPSQFAAPDRTRPIGQVDLFVDGCFFETLARTGPGPGNIISIDLNGYPVELSVPAAASLTTLTRALADLINTPDFRPAMPVVALATGDRLDLQALPQLGAAPSYFPALSSPVRHYYRITRLPLHSPPALAPPARKPDGTLAVSSFSPTRLPYAVEASTNLVHWTRIATNMSGLPAETLETVSQSAPCRFYRTVPLLDLKYPRVAVEPKPQGLHVRVRGGDGSAYTLERSHDLANWTPILKSLDGSPAEHLEPDTSSRVPVFFRAAVAHPEPPVPGMTLVSAPNGLSKLIRVEPTAWPYTLEISTNLDCWAPVFTNLQPASLRLAASTHAASPSPLTTWAHAARDTFLPSLAYGEQTIGVGGTVQAGSWLQFEATLADKTNWRLAVTNLNPYASILDVVNELVSRINTHPKLAGPGGLCADDLSPAWFGSATFTLRAREPGWQPAQVRVHLTGSSSLLITPEGTTPLIENETDLRPRNHIYLSAGAPVMRPTLRLDTTNLPDGYHELIAVAYEGTHVRTQSKLPLPITVQNSSRLAILLPLDPTEAASLHTPFRLRLIGNIRNISSVQLHSTGGAIASFALQIPADFQFDPSPLGAGRHPVHASIETTDGFKFRTHPVWIRFQR